MMKGASIRLAVPLAGVGAVVWLAAAEPRVESLLQQANGETLLTAAAEAGALYRIETSPDLREWTGFLTVRSTGRDQVVDVGTPRRERRYYRARPVEDPGAMTGDHLVTTEGEAVVHPIGHASVAVAWNGKVLFSDPSDQNGNGPRFAGLPMADVLHCHSSSATCGYQSGRSCLHFGGGRKTPGWCHRCPVLSPTSRLRRSGGTRANLSLTHFQEDSPFNHSSFGVRCFMPGSLKRTASQGRTVWSDS